MAALLSLLVLHLLHAASPSPSPANTDWEVSVTTVDDRPATVRFKGELRASAPDRARPWLLILHVALQAPTASGFPSDAERPALTELEEGVEDELTEAGGVLTGIITGGRKVQITGHLPSREKAEAVGAAVVQEHEAFKIGVETRSDPLWQHYTEELCPTEARNAMVKDLEIIAARKKAGDVLTRVRPVEHFLYFRDEQQREKAAAEAAALGFSVGEEGGPKETDEHPFGLNLTKPHRLDPETVHKEAGALREIAAKHNGRYDEWGAAIVSGKAPAPTRKGKKK